MCSIEAHEKIRNQSTITNLLIKRHVVVVTDHFHRIQRKTHYNYLVYQLTSLRVGLNNSILIMEIEQQYFVNK